TPTEGRVRHHGCAGGEGSFGLHHHVGGAAHRFGTACHHRLTPTGRQSVGGGQHCLQSGSTQTVDRHSGNGVGQTRQQGGHSSDVAVVLACLVGRSPHHVDHRRRVDPGIALHQSRYRPSRQIVRPHMGEGSTQLAHRGAASIDDEDI